MDFDIDIDFDIIDIDIETQGILQFLFSRLRK